MIRDLLEHFSTAGRFLLVICLILLIFSYNKLPEGHRRLTPFIIITLITEITADYLSVNSIPNLFLLHIYTALEFICWTYYYLWLFRKDKTLRVLLLKAGFIIPVLLLANTIFLEPISVFNSNAKTLISLLLLCYAFLYFFKSFGKLDLTRPIPKANMIINFGVLIYYASSLFIFMFSKLLIMKDVNYPHQMVLWVMNSFVYVIFLILLLISLWTVFSKMKSSS